MAEGLVDGAPPRRSHTPAQVKAIWKSRAYQAAAKYCEHAPMAAVCCNACRACATTNLPALATGAGLAAIYAIGRFARRVVWRSADIASAS